MAGLPKDRPVPTYRCPHCGDQIFRLPGSHEYLRCNHCSHRYMVLIDEQTRTAAFVDQAAKPGSEPLWLPKGSIRALVALSLAAAALVVVVLDRNVPAALLSLLLTVVGFYFGFRVKSSTLGDRLYDPTASREQPLHLPSGVIRGLLVLSLSIAGVLLAMRGELGSSEEQFGFFVILAALVVGHYFARLVKLSGGSGGPLGHVKALAVLGLTAALVWIFVAGVDESMPPWSVILLCGTVSFYFGSRS